MLRLGKYSLGMGDRFAHQAKAQLRACLLAADAGVEIIPVWNKSNREHTTIGSEPGSVRTAADEAVRALGWTKDYFVDADHIRMETVDRFLPASNFFTIDVADFIGREASADSVHSFVRAYPQLAGQISVPGLDQPIEIIAGEVERVARKFLFAVQEAGRIFRHIEAAKGAGQFVAEVSMDETDAPQSPVELLIILAAMAREKIAVQTIAPKFTGRFNKGVDYVGNVAQFEKEFNADLAIIAWSVNSFGLPSNLKLSVHSGSDKFSIYAPIHRALRRFDAGVHLKTAGTTWLEEVIGLAEAGGEGLELAKEIYAEALGHVDELCAPYAAVIDIEVGKLPSEAEVRRWTAGHFVSALRHDPRNPGFNPHLRQLLHVGYKVAAKMGDRYLHLLERCEKTIARNVTENLYDRHVRPVFLGK